MSNSRHIPRDKSTDAYRNAVNAIAESAASQSDKFIEAARGLGANDSEATFKMKLSKIAKMAPKGDFKKPG